MRSVSRFEVNVLRVLYALMQRAPVQQTLPMLDKPLPRPKCLSRDAVALIQDTLAKGSVQLLARQGWKRERYLRAGRIAEGRLWQRTPPLELGLRFSKHSLEFLLQLVSGTLGTTLPKATDLALGDRLLFFLAFDAFRSTNAGEEMRKKWLPLYQDGLCRLFFLEELPERTRRVRIDWLCWTTGQGATILEALHERLAGRWTQLEGKKETLSNVARMRAIGTNQQRVYGEYLDGLENRQRWDLARPFLETAQRLLQDQPGARKWIRNLNVSGERLADRLTIYHETLAFLRQMERFQRWQQQAIGIGYFDEGYQASQLWKADWERYGGDRLCECARAIVREVEPIK